MRELRYLEVYTAKKIRNLRIGPYTSPLRGTGFEFDEHRPYRERDDVRRIDWNVTARLNAPYLRQTHAERELNVVVALDLSPSMAFGSARYSKKGGNDLYRRVDPLLRHERPDQSRFSGVLGPRPSLVGSPPRGRSRLAAPRGALVDRGLRNAYSGPARGSASCQPAANHERGLPRVGLHHRRTTSLPARSFACSRRDTM